MALGILMKPSPRKEICSPKFWRDAWAEVMASMILIFTATSVGFHLAEDEAPVPILWVALANGLAVFVLIEMLGHVSGASMNPVVSVMFMITKKLSPLKAGVYIMAECLGGITGASIAYGVTNPVAREALQPIGLNNISVGAGVGCEAFITHTLCLTIQGATDAAHRPTYMPGLAVGFAVVVGLLTAGRITGAAMNPLISLGPCVVTGNFTDHWVYWVGPLTGMLIAALEYNIIYCSFWPKEDADQDDTSVKDVKETNGNVGHDNTAYHMEEHTNDPETRF